MKKIVKELIKADDEKKLQQFEKLIKANYRVYESLNEKDYKTVVKLLMQMWKDENKESGFKVYTRRFGYVLFVVGIVAMIYLIWFK